MKTLLIVALIALCSACASDPASSISLAVVDDVSLAQVRANNDAYQGSTVRWGGVVAEVENRADTTWVFLVQQELRDDAKPIADSASDGRFVARFDGFVDPVVYKLGRSLTVVGRIDGSVQRAIGEFEYRFPIVAVLDSHLWAEEVRIRHYYPPPPWWYRDYHYRPFPYHYPDW